MRITVPGDSLPNGVASITAEVLVRLTREKVTGLVPVLLNERGIVEGAVGSKFVPEIVICVVELSAIY